MKNFSREIDEQDRGEVYYKMKRNPQKLLCDTFWDIVRMTILKNYWTKIVKFDEQNDD